MPSSTSRSSRAFSDVKVRPSMKVKKEKSDKKANKIIPQVEVASLKDFCADTIEEAFWDSVPEAVKELPDPHMTRFAIFVTMGTLATFIFFTILQFQKSKNFTFVSLDPNAGICTSVSLGVTSPTPFVGTTTGYWQGEKDFDASDSAYLLTLSNYNGDNAAYSKMMQSFAQDIKKISDIGNKKTAPYNTALWISFYANYSTCTQDDNSYCKKNHNSCSMVATGDLCKQENQRQQILRLSGSPDAIFDPLFSYTSGLVGNLGYCNIQQVLFTNGGGINYDPATKSFSFSFPGKYFASNEPPADDSDDVYYPPDSSSPTEAPTQFPSANGSAGFPSFAPTASVPSFAPTRSPIGSKSPNMVHPNITFPTAEPTKQTHFPHDHGPLTCYSLIEQFNFADDLDADYGFSFGYNIESFMTAYAVNVGILPYDALETVEKSVDDDAIVKTSLKYDPKFPGMEPVLCIDPKDNNGKPLCALPFIPSPFGSIGVGLPLFYSQGLMLYDFATLYGPPNINSTCPPCSSPIYDGTSYIDTVMQDSCNQLAFISGLAVFNTASDLLDISVKFQNDYEAINEAAFDAAAWSANGGFNAVFHSNQDFHTYVINDYNETLIDSSSHVYKLVNDSLAFCGETCIVTAFGTLSSSYKIGRVLNDYFTQVDQISCANGINSNAAFSASGLAGTPPLILTEKYFQCRNRPEDTFLDSIGIANGNTAILVPIAISILLPFVYYYFKLIGYNPPVTEYDTTEKADILDALAVHLMRIRDGKTRSFKKKGLAMKLVQELKNADKIPPGYPDSDDDLKGSDDSSSDDNCSDDDGEKGKKNKSKSKSKSKNVSSSNSSTGSSNNKVKGKEAELELELTSFPARKATTSTASPYATSTNTSITSPASNSTPTSINKASTSTRPNPNPNRNPNSVTLNPIVSGAYNTTSYNINNNNSTPNPSPLSPSSPSSLSSLPPATSNRNSFNRNSFGSSSAAADADSDDDYDDSENQ